jgi:hypothetical protein
MVAPTRMLAMLSPLGDGAARRQAGAAADVGYGRARALPDDHAELLPRLTGQPPTELHCANNLDTRSCYCGPRCILALACIRTVSVAPRAGQTFGKAREAGSGAWAHGTYTEHPSVPWPVQTAGRSFLGG